jgi:CheY-like chemotaxis protein
MVAEDNEFNMMTIAEMLFRKFEIKPVEAQNGQIAIELFKEAMNRPCKCPNRAFKLIFMDIQMPLVTGIEATE